MGRYTIYIENMGLYLIQLCRLWQIQNDHVLWISNFEKKKAVQLRLHCSRENEGSASKRSG